MSLAALSDSILDGAFAASFDAGDHAAADYYGAEIRDRLTSIRSFAGGLLGEIRFPKFEARLNFSQQEAARVSTQQSAAGVADSIGGVLKTGGMTLALLGLAGIAVYAILSRK